MSDGIIGSVGVAVVPDADGFWREFRRRTDPGAESAGRDLGRGVRRGMDEELAVPVNVRVNTNTSDIQNATRQTHLLRDAIVFLGPATIPVAGVLSGAFLGAIPAAATLALGVKGISDEMKRGALNGTQYGKDLAALGAEGDKLKGIAASGLLSGIDRALQSSGPLFKEVNSDVGVMSAQLGNIVASAGPALLSIFTALNPLFVTFGNLLTTGAGKLEHWVTSSGGIQSFVAYVQTELPTVVHTFSELVQTVGRLAEALAPVGHAVLSGIGLLAGALNAIPLGVLQTLAPLLLAGYAAFRVYRGVDAIVNRVSGAIEKLGATQAAHGASASAAALEVEAAAASEAAAVAESAAVEAAATRDAAVQIAASLEGTNSVLAANATAAAEASIEFAAAMQAEADAAAAAAARIAAAAEAESGAVAESGAAASAGMAGLLGPVAAVGVGILLLTSIFGGNNEAAQHNAEIMNGYAESLKQSANGLAEVNIQQTAKNLQDAGAVKLMQELAANNVAVTASTRGAQGSTDGLRLSQAQLVLAVNGTQKQYDSLYGSLIKVADANRQDSNSDSRVAAYNATGQAALSLAGKIKQLRDDMTGEMKVQAELADIQKQSQIAIDGGASATAEQARQLGLTTDGYLAAQTAAKKNTDQTNKQAAAFQLANDGGSLLAATLDKLSGKKLSYAQTLNSFQSQLVTGGPKGTPGTPGTPGTGNAAAVAAATSRQANAIEAEALAQRKYNEALAKGNTDAIAAAHLRLARAKTAVTTATNALNAAEKSGGGTAGKAAVAADTRLRGLSAAAVQNRNDIISLVSSAEQTAEAYGKMTGSSEKSRQKLIDLRTQLINSRVALGENRAEVTKFVDSILKIPATVPPTKLDVAKTAADLKITTLKRQIADIKQGKVPGLEVYTADGQAMIKRLQAKIDALHGKTVLIDIGVLGTATRSTVGTHNALVDNNGTIIGPGHAAGGLIVGNGSGTSDTAGLFPLSNREFVMSNKAVDKFGIGFMQAVNAGRLPPIQAPSLTGRDRSTRPVVVNQTFHGVLPTTADRLSPTGIRRAGNDLARSR